MTEGQRANWYVAWICCFLTFLLLGLARLSSLLFVAVMDHYDVSRTEASLPFVLCYTVRNIAGPLIGYLGRRWGFHKVCISGCIISTLGVGLCFFADHIIIVTILWGGVFGLGLGLTTILIPEVLRQHFTDHVSKANGIAFGGECLAGFILPVLFDISLNKYGTQGTFLILSGLILNSLPAALFLTQMKPSCETKEISKHNEMFSASVKGRNSSTDENSLRKNSSHNLTYRVQSSVNNSQYSEKILCPAENNHTFYYTSNGYDCDENHRSSNDDSHFIGCHKSLLNHSNISNFEKSVERKISDSVNNDAALAGREKTSAFKSFTVFFDITFILILISQSLFIYIATTALTIVVDYAKDIGVVGQEEIYIVMGISIADMVGRFGLGFITDSAYMTNIYFAVSSYTSMGLLLLASVWVRGFVLLLVTMLPFGLLLGGLLIVLPGIVLDFVEEDKITMALASRFSLYGPLSLTQSPFIGFFRGHLGSYNGVYYVLSILCFLCSGLTILTPLAAKRRDLRATYKQEQQQVSTT